MPESFRKYYTFDPPEEFLALYDTFPKGKASLPMVSEKEFAAVEAATKVDGECFALLRKLNTELFADKERNAAARFLRHGLFEACPPWANGIWQQQLLTVEGFPQELVDLLIVTAALGYTLTVRKPPESLNAENLNAYKGYIDRFVKANGRWGIENPTWNRLCAGGCMFLFHTLKFQPEYFSRDFLVLTADGKEYVTVIKGGFAITKDGELTEPENPHEKRTAFYETEQGWRGHIVRPNGIVEQEISDFSKKEWKVALCEKDVVLGFHIPARAPYTPEEHRESMRQALEFYRGFYPELNFKAFVCYSWLYSLQNAELLPEGSRILEMQKYGHLCPMLARLGVNKMFLRPGSILANRAQAYFDSGKVWRTGFMYSPLSEAKTFGRWRHD